MSKRTGLFLVLLAVLVAVVWMKRRPHVPVPDRLSTSRDWEEPDNAELFRPVEGDAHLRGYGDTVYDELGKETLDKDKDPADD